MNLKYVNNKDPFRITFPNEAMYQEYAGKRVRINVYTTADKFSNPQLFVIEDAERKVPFGYDARNFVISQLFWTNPNQRRFTQGSQRVMDETIRLGHIWSNENKRSDEPSSFVYPIHEAAKIILIDRVCI